MINAIQLVNHWEVEVVRAGVVVAKREFYNLVPTAGLNKLLDANFYNGNAAPAWYVGLISTGATFAAADTSSSHAGWTETTAYDQLVRQLYVPAAPALGIATNTASKASFTMSSGVTLAGAFMIDSSTKGGTSGTLFGEGAFSAGDTAVVAADVVNVTVTVTLASGSVTGGFMPIKEEVFGNYHP